MRQGFEGIPFHQTEVGVIPEGLLTQDPAKPMVNLKGGDLGSLFKQQACDRADARTDLPNLLAFAHLKQIDDALTHRVGDQEVLSKLLAHRQILPIQKASDCVR